MAEYIDRNDLIRFFDNFRQPKKPFTDGFKFLLLEDVIKVIAERPTADVVEQVKIDKAIEEMEFHIKCNTNPKTSKVNLLGQGQIMMLNILKKNLGE